MTIREEVQERIRQDPELNRIRRKIENGNATYADTSAYSIRSGKLLGEILSGHVLDIPAEDREQLCVDLLHDRYVDINLVVDEVQSALDAAQGLRIAPHHAPENTERSHQIGSSLRDPTKPDDVIQRRAGAATETATKAVHDDRMKSEAKFRKEAGLKSYLNRVAAAGCCPWCSKIAGRYVYGDHPEDIFGRHDNCDCSVTFESGRQRQDVWSKKTWEAPGIGAGAGDLTVLTEEQVAGLQQKRTLNVLTNQAQGGIMSLEEWCDKYKPLKSDKAVPALRKESEKWIESLSSEEKRAITKYSRNPGDEGEEKFYYRLNSMLSGKTPKDPTLQYYADTISGSLNKYDLKHAIICYRSVGSNPLQGLSVGDVYTPNQYISTSVTSKGALDKKFKIVILAPPGSNGAYIENLSEYPKQREFLFNDKCRYTIIELTEDSAVLGVII